MARTYTTKICETCNKDFNIRQSDVNRGRGRFCGKSCAAKGKNNSSYRHGNAERNNRSLTYSSWASMHSRLKNKNYHAYHRYAGRGITICDRWELFDNFLEDMGGRPSNTTLERMDNDGNYEPSNCRWATKKEQASNQSSNVLLTLKGETHTQEEWGRLLGLSGAIICKRLKRGWSVEKALTTPRLR